MSTAEAHILTEAEVGGPTDPFPEQCAVCERPLYPGTQVWEIEGEAYFCSRECAVKREDENEKG